MKQVKIFILLVLATPLFLKAQLNEEELNDLLFEKVNAYREENNLHPLEYDELLDAASFDQALYISKLGKIIHEQDNSKKESVADRILYYEGLHAESGENAAIVSIGTKEPLIPGGARREITNEELAIQAAITSWLNDEKSSKLNLLDPNFYRMGSAIIIKEERQFTIVAVMASIPYSNPDVNKLPIDFHGIEPYNEESCKEFLEEHPSLPQLLSDAIQVENGTAYLSYHSLGFMREILEHSNDGIALDIIHNMQYDCNSGNSLFPTSINDGYLYSPIRKGKLNTQNLAKDPTELKISLGNLPPYYNDIDCELNLVIVKKGTHCATVPFNQIKTNNKRWLDLEYQLAGENDTLGFTWQDSTVFSYTFSSSEEWEKKWEQDFNMLKQFNYELSSVKVELQRSPIMTNERVGFSDSTFQEELGIAIDYQERTAWKELDEFAKGSFYQLDLAELDTAGKIEHLTKSVQTDLRLAAFLDSISVIKFYVKGKAQIPEEYSVEEGIRLYQLLLENNKIQASLHLQSHLIGLVRKGKLAAHKIPKADPSQQQKTLPLINNQIVLEQALGNDSYDGNSMNLAFLELALIDKKLAVVNFNYRIAQLKTWSENLNEIQDWEMWSKEFRKLASKPSIPKVKYARAMLNYSLVASDYYYEKENFDGRKKAFQEIMKWQAYAKLSTEEILELGQMLCFQDQFSYAIKLLKPFVNKEEVEKELLFYYLQIAIYDRYLVPEGKYFSKMKLAFEKFPEESCKLFSKNKMGIQALKNQQIKEIYCNTCNH